MAPPEPQVSPEPQVDQEPQVNQEPEVNQEPQQASSSKIVSIFQKNYKKKIVISIKKER